MILFTHLIKEHLLYEGLIHSVSRSKFQDMVRRWAVANDKVKILFNKDDNTKIIIIFLKSPDSDELDNLLKLINNLGWYVSAYLRGDTMKWQKFEKEDFLNERTRWVLHSFQVEAKFDLDLTDQEFDVVYHITPSINDKKIQKIGLVPKSLEKISYHPERVYFSRTKESLESLAKQFHKLNKDMKEFSVYEVDMKKVMDDNDQLRLFLDPNFEKGIYTLSNIPPKYLRFIGKIETP